MYKLLVLLFALFLNSFSSIASAQVNHRVDLLSAKNISNLAALANNPLHAKVGDKSVRSKDLDNPLMLRMRVAGIGRFESVLSTQRFYGLNSTDLAFLQGEVVNLSNGMGRNNASFATVVNQKNGDKLLRLFAVSKSRRSKWKGILEIRATVNSENKIKKLSFHRSKRANPDKMSCGANSSQHSEADHLFANELPTIKAEVLIAKILVQADFEYVNQISGSMSSELGTIMNGVDAIYQRDLGLSFNANIETTPTAYTEPIQYNNNFEIRLHNEMIATKPASTRDADIHYLFTGKAPVGADLANLAGVVADLGTVCKKPDLSVGLTIRIDTATDIVVTSHEIGHLYNAEHDDNFTNENDPKIMSSVISDSITSFSSYSYDQIGAFVAANNTCLLTGTGGTPPSTPPSTPTTLPATALVDAYKDGKFFVLELYDGEDDSAYADYAVEVLFKKNKKSTFATIKRLVTDEDGVAFFRPKKDGLYAFKVETLQSRQLKFRRFR